MNFKVVIKFQLQLKTNKKLPLQLIGAFYAYCVMPFGLYNVLATFQRVVMMVFQDYPSLYGNFPK